MDQEAKQIMTNFDDEYLNFKNKVNRNLIKEFLKQKGVKKPLIITSIKGARLIGEKIGKNVQGWVCMKYENDTVYIGEMYKRMRHGFGMRSYRNSDIVYIGDYHQNKKHGKGKIIRITDEFLIYNGDWNDEDKHGYGILIGKDAKYEGNFIKDEMEGRGKMEWDNGDIYEGEFIKGCKEGYGIIKFGNRDIYEGNFVNNLMHGPGIYKWATGEIYKGNFMHGQMLGEGEIQFNDKNVIGSGNFSPRYRNLKFKLIKTIQND